MSRPKKQAPASPDAAKAPADPIKTARHIGKFSMMLRLLLRNWRALVGFEALYKLAVSVIVIPFLFAMFSLTIRAAGLTYLSTESVRAYLLHPVTIVCLPIMLLIAAFVSLFDMQAIICCCHASRLDRSTSVSELLFLGFSRARKVFVPKNFLLILFVMVVIPFTNAAAVSGLISRIELPEFIADYIHANMPLRILWFLLSAALTFIAFRWCLSLHALTLEDKDYPASCRESARLMKGHLISTVVGTFLAGICLELLLLAIGCVVTALAFLFIRFVLPLDMRFSAAASSLLFIATAGSYVSMGLSSPAAFAFLSVRYYQYRQTPPSADVFAPVTRGGKNGRLLLLALLVALLASADVQFRFSDDLKSTADLVLQRPEIAAHRGSSVAAPENSMAAFRQAIADNADWIELDVHQTKDGVVVVTHDESIKRIAGVKKNVWELTYDELSKYDAGSWFSPEFSYLRVATLDEVLKLCKGTVKLNIELKPTGHEPDFEQNVLRLIRQNGYEKGEYLLASLDANALKNIKRLEPDAPTLYIMTIAAGNVKDIPFADAYSVEESSVTERLVTSVHAAGKRVHVWTVNRSENVEGLSDLDVDCIITDDPVMVRTALDAAALSDGLSEIVSLFFPDPAPDEEIPADYAIEAEKSLRAAPK